MTDENETTMPGERGDNGFDTPLANRLLRARETILRRQRQCLKADELTDQQWRILRALAPVERHEAGDLARAAVLLGPSLSRIIRELERRDLVLRGYDENDLRRCHFALSAEGRAMVERIDPDMLAVEAGVARLLGTRRYQKLGTWLDEFVAGSDELDLAG